MEADAEKKKADTAKHNTNYKTIEYFGFDVTTSRDCTTTWINLNLNQSLSAVV